MKPAYLLVVALLAGCAVDDSRPVDALVSHDSSLIALSVRQSYKFRVDYFRVTIASLDTRGTEGFALSHAPFRFVKDTSKEIVRTHSKGYVGYEQPGGVLNVIRLKPGRYVLSEWVKPEEGGAIVFNRVVIPIEKPELRGPIGLQFVVQPGEVVYLGELLLDEGGRGTASDCKERDLPLLYDLVDGLKNREIRIAPLGTATCIK
jgi:hypothetical protein